MLKSDSSITVLDSKGSLYFCLYSCGLYSVERSTKATGYTIKADYDKESIERLYNSMTRA